MQVFMDVTDMIDYNIELLNHNDLGSSFFHLNRNDPTTGFPYDASSIYGHTYPATPVQPLSPPSSTTPSPQSSGPHTIFMRLLLGSHLAQYLRHQLEEQNGYTSTVGISTTKLVSKLVGNVNKPKGQTTLIPPYESTDEYESNVTTFIDAHDIGKIPGIGFRLAQKIRQHVLRRRPAFDAGLVYGGTKEHISVRDVRLFPGMCAELLETLLGGPGSPKGIGEKVWGLINGVDDTEVGKARIVPRQISIEDSYIRLDKIDEVKNELRMLAGSLVRRMRMDLTEDDDDNDLPVDDDADSPIAETARAKRRWLAHPRTLRLTTRPRPHRNPDGSRTRCFNRISRSSPMPTFVFSLTENVEGLVDKLVDEILIPIFRKLHPEKSGWDLSLVNVAVTNMAETATDGKDGTGRDIGRMFKRQESVLREWKVEDMDMAPSDDNNGDEHQDARVGGVLCLEDATEHNMKGDHSQHPHGSEDLIQPSQHSIDEEGAWDSEEHDSDIGDSCKTCGAIMPAFAMTAHETFHAFPD